MFCNKCGKELAEGTKFCCGCGNQVGELEKTDSVKSSDADVVKEKVEKSRNSNTGVPDEVLESGFVNTQNFNNATMNTVERNPKNKKMLFSILGIIVVLVLFFTFCTGGDAVEIVKQGSFYDDESVTLQELFDIAFETSGSWEEFISDDDETCVEVIYDYYGIEFLMQFVVDTVSLEFEMVYAEIDGESQYVDDIIDAIFVEYYNK